MRDIFPEHYQPNKKRFKELWGNALFVFDANILLHIYRYSDETRSTFFQVLEGLQGRLWVPYQVALEFQENRLDVILGRRLVYQKTIANFEQMVTTFKESSTKILANERKTSPAWADLDEAFKLAISEESIRKAVDFLKDKEKQLPSLSGEDPLRDQLDRFLSGCVGPIDSEENATARSEEAKRRCDAQIPPGYADHKKDESRRYNDAIAWMQTLDYVSSLDKKPPIIFVTDDAKEDWFLKKGGQTIGPRPELVQEVKNKVGVDFYLYTGAEFIKWASSGSVTAKSPEQKAAVEAAVKEAREVQEEWETLSNVTSDKKDWLHNFFKATSNSSDDRQPLPMSDMLLQTKRRDIIRQFEMLERRVQYVYELYHLEFIEQNLTGEAIEFFFSSKFLKIQMAFDTIYASEGKTFYMFLDDCRTLGHLLTFAQSPEKYIPEFLETQSTTIPKILKNNIAIQTYVLKQLLKKNAPHLLDTNKYDWLNQF